MPITLNDLTVNIDHLDQETLLAPWHWLIGARRLPILVTAMGNAFVQDADSGAISLLDAGTGKLVEVADSPQAFQALLGDTDFVMEQLLVNDWAAARDAGLMLAPGQVFGYKTPPVLGGGFETDNLEPTDIAVHFGLLGQIHQQVKDLPAGTPVSSIKIG
jgi:hypothetical protein